MTVDRRDWLTGSMRAVLFDAAGAETEMDTLTCPDGCTAGCTFICVEKTVDRRCPVGVTIFLGWLFILDREDICTAFVSGTGTPLKEGN
jgi:hypothetical protein